MLLPVSGKDPAATDVLEAPAPGAPDLLLLELGELLLELDGLDWPQLFVEFTLVLLLLELLALPELEPLPEPAF